MTARRYATGTNAKMASEKRVSMKIDAMIDATSAIKNKRRSGHEDRGDRNNFLSIGLQGKRPETRCESDDDNIDRHSERDQRARDNSRASNERCASALKIKGRDCETAVATRIASSLTRRRS